MCINITAVYATRSHCIYIYISINVVFVLSQRFDVLNDNYFVELLCLICSQKYTKSLEFFEFLHYIPHKCFPPDYFKVRSQHMCRMADIADISSYINIWHMGPVWLCFVSFLIKFLLALLLNEDFKYKSKWLEFCIVHS